MSDRIIEKPLSDDPILPEINGDRCVHALIETASCQACVDSCPKNAWVLDDESLGLDTSLCDGCGLCVPVCTEGAITQSKDCTIREENNKKVLLIGCEFIANAKKEITTKSKNWACIHAVSTGELLGLYQQGIKQIVVSKGDCESCLRGNNEHLYNRVIKISKMLRHSHLPPLHYNELPADKWHQLWKTQKKSMPGPEMSRRRFFQSAIKQTVDMVLHKSILDLSKQKFIPLAKIVDGIEGENVLFPAVPVINEEKCNGCDTCFRACPHGALQFNITERNALYFIDAANCTDCSICTDLCEEEAIHILNWSTQNKPDINLIVKKCNSCGAIFHYPKLSDAGNLPRQLCNICEKVDHQRNLFQVLE